jgi:hypothetical protein
MTAVSEAPSAAGVAPGIADADKFGANARVQAANPINKSRFILAFPPLKSPNRDREQSFGNSSGSVLDRRGMADQGSMKRQSRSRLSILGALNVRGMGTWINGWHFLVYQGLEIGRALGQDSRQFGIIG